MFRPTRHLPRLLLIVCLWPANAAFAEGEALALSVEISGIAHKRGAIVTKLFRRGDDVPRGRGFRELRVQASNPKLSVRFADLAEGQYALFVYHDENDNGTLDHNFIGIPTEPMGFSNGFQVSLLSGIPDFEDLAFGFSKRARYQRIIVE